MNDVAWNPALAHLFGMSDGGGLVGLLDGRTAWKDDGDDIVARLLVDYHTKLLRPLCPPTPFVGDPFQVRTAAFSVELTPRSSSKPHRTPRRSRSVQTAR